MNLIRRIKNYIEDNKFDKELEEYQNYYYINENETKDLLFIWGILSHDNIGDSKHANMFTLNDLDIIYHKDEKKYSLHVETIYMFQENGQYGYMQSLLDEFTQWMIKNNYNINRSFPLFKVFTDGISINTKFDSIEEAYAAFKMMVNGYCSLANEEK